MNNIRAAAAWRIPPLDLSSTTALPPLYSTRATRGFILSPPSRSLAPRPDHCVGLFSLEELLVEADPGEGVPRAISSPCHQVRQYCASCPTLSLKQAPTRHDDRDPAYLKPRCWQSAGTLQGLSAAADDGAVGDDLGVPAAPTKRHTGHVRQPPPLLRRHGLEVSRV